MRVLTMSFAVAAIAVLPFSPSYAQGRGGSKPKHRSPHTTTPAVTHGSSTAAHGPAKTATAKSHGPTIPKTTKTHGPSATQHGSPNKTKATTATTQTKGSSHKAPATTIASTAAATTTGTTTGTGGSSGSTSTLNPIAQKISSKPQLSARLEKMLPKGMTLNAASEGFRNQGQFVAALHVSQNLNIPFKELRAAMLGINPTPASPLPGSTVSGSTTTASPMSLGQAIQKLRPRANAGAEVAHAQTQATATTTATAPLKKSGRR